jgi:hypothetical protein
MLTKKYYQQENEGIIMLFVFFGVQLLSGCSARDWERSGLLEENPQSGCSDICASLKGPL